MSARLVAALASLALVGAADAATPPLGLAATIPLPGVEGRIDHLDLDARRHRLFVAALGDDSVDVVDLEQRTAIRRIANLREPQGVAYAPAADRLVVAEGGAARVDFYAGDDLAKVASLAVRDDADDLRVDANGGLVYLGHGSGHDGAIGIIDAGAAKLLADIVVDGHPEAFAVEASGPRIFVNVPDRQVVVVIDRVQRTLLATWELPARANFPMALDEAHGRLFVGCRRPSSIVVLDTATGGVVQRVDAPGDLDDVWFDARSGRVYVTGGDGAIGVLGADADGAWTVVATIETAAGARTSLLDAAGRTLFVAVPSASPRDAEIRAYRLP